MRTHEEIQEYVEWQCQNKCKVLSAKTEQSFYDLGEEVRVWNVKTDLDGSWWVVEGDHVPMNLYTQDAYYFGTDEVYSFHMGIMARMRASHEDYQPEEYISAASVNAEIAPPLLRKLKVVANLIDTAVEVEDFQAIGVQCREIMIELGNEIYSPFMAGETEQPKSSDFKKKAELFISFYLAGSDNGDYRNIYKRMTESTWDFANKITHSKNATFYEVSSCIAMCIATVSIYENIRQKNYDLLSKYTCKKCKSKRLKITDDEHDEQGLVSKLYLECEECGLTTEVILT